MTQAKKIGLALSGGGAIGAAHIGILEEIEKNQIEIHSISGSSAGAIAGLLFADGGIKEVNEFFADLKTAGLFNRANLIFQRNTRIFETIEKLLRKHVKAKEFSQLPINFYVVVTNFLDGSTVVLEKGDLIEAVMASAAYPGVFPPQKIDSQYFIDGGITRNLPASLLKEKGMDFVIGSSLYMIEKIKTLDSGNELRMNALKVAMRAVDIMSQAIAEIDEKECDFCFHPPVENYYWFDFNRAEEIKRIGQDYAAKEINGLLMKLKMPPRKRGFWETIFGE